MSAILHISDTHFGTERPAVMAALLRLAEACRPQLVLLSGDITQRARHRQFAAAKAFVEQFPAPVLAIPGNHDIPLFDLARRVFAPYDRYRRSFGALEGEWSSDDWLVIAINTTRNWRHKDGHVSAAQVARVAERLAAATPRQVRVVAVHQPMAVIRAEDEKNLLHGHAEAARAWAAAGVDIVVGGHIHLPYVRPLWPLPDRRLWVVQAGTATSHRVRGAIPNSVNIVRREERVRRCRVERWDYAVEEGAFVCHHAQALGLA